MQRASRFAFILGMVLFAAALLMVHNRSRERKAAVELLAAKTCE